MKETNDPKSVRKMLDAELTPGKKYEEIVRQQEAITEHISELNDEEYQRLYVEKKGKGPGYWFMVFLIVVSVLALISSLPEGWTDIFSG